MKSSLTRLMFSTAVLAAGLGALALTSIPAHAEEGPACGELSGNVCQKVEWCVELPFAKTCTASFKYYAP